MLDQIVKDPFSVLLLDVSKTYNLSVQSDFWLAKDNVTAKDVVQFISHMKLLPTSSFLIILLDNDENVQPGIIQDLDSVFNKSIQFRYMNTRQEMLKYPTLHMKQNTTLVQKRKQLQNFLNKTDHDMPCRLDNMALYIGTKGSSSETFIHQLGIDVILCLTMEAPRFMPDKVVLHMPFKDCEQFEKENMSEYLTKISETIHQYLNQNQTLLIHCQAGKSRSCLVVLYYLVTKHRVSLTEAWRRVFECRPVVLLNKGFAEFLVERFCHDQLIQPFWLYEEGAYFKHLKLLGTGQVM